MSQDNDDQAEEILTASGLPPMRRDVVPDQPIPGEVELSARLAEARYYLTAASEDPPWSALSTAERFPMRLEASTWVRAGVLAGLITPSTPDPATDAESVTPMPVMDTWYMLATAAVPDLAPEVAALMRTAWPLLHAPDRPLGTGALPEALELLHTVLRDPAPASEVIVAVRALLRLRRDLPPLSILPALAQAVEDLADAYTDS